MYWKTCLGAILVFQLFMQTAVAAVINVYPAGPGRLHRAEAPVVSLTPKLWWARVPGVDTYRITIMAIENNGTVYAAFDQSGIVGVPATIGGTSQWLSHNIPQPLPPNKLYFWTIRPSKPELQATNFTAMYFRTGVTEPSPGAPFKEMPGPVINSLTPMIQWPSQSNGPYSLLISDDTAQKVILRQQTTEPYFQVPPNLLLGGRKYMWDVRSPGAGQIDRWFQTPAEPFRCGLSNEVRIVVGRGIGFKVMGGIKPYNIYEGQASVVKSFRQGQDAMGEDFQINALSPGTTQVVISDKSNPVQHIRIIVVVTQK